MSHPRVTSRCRPASGATLLGCVSLLAWLGCLAPAHLDTLDLSTPGWATHQGQAVWQPAGESSDLAGELLFARHTNGTLVVQFTKTPLPWITAECTPTRWRLHHHAANRTWKGRGEPPSDLAWAVLAHCLGHRPPPAPWQFEPGPDGTWELTRADSRESIRGYLQPPATAFAP